MAQSCARAFAGAWLLLSFVLLSSSAPKADARGYGGPRLGAAAQKGRHLLPTGGNFWATFQPTEESVPVAGADNREEGFDPRPLIGILTKPGKGSLEEDGQEKTNTSHIEASYVKWVESGGARAVPILFNSTEEQLEKTFKQINGILFPGGSANLSLESAYMKTARKLFNLTIEANKRDDYFPLHGTCLGFEKLSVIVAGEEAVLDPYTMRNKPSTLHFVSEEARARAVFSKMDDDLKDKLEKKPLAMENHKYALSPKKLLAAEHKRLSRFFCALTTTIDENGKEYVSTMEAREYPITATMWHPEKNAFEWAVPDIPHSEDAVRVTQAAANFFVNEARKNFHKPESVKAEQDLLIYNYCPIFVEKRGAEHTQIYVFEDPAEATRMGGGDVATF